MPIVRGAEVVALSQDGDGVTVECAGGEKVRAKYVVGCDGAHSTIRDLVGIDFVGKQYETHILLADVALSRAPGDTLTGVTNERGVVLMIPFGDGWFRAIAWDRLREQAPMTEPVTLDEIRDSFVRIAGEDFGMTDMRWSSRFLSERRQARHYRSGRVFIAGDAAHVHSPLGGQGMNTGIGDAMNLGWKLVAAVNGTAPPALLDSYESERHPVGAAVLRTTDAFNQVVLGSSRIQRIARNIVIGTLTRRPENQATDAANSSAVSVSPTRTSVATIAWWAAGCRTSTATARACTNFCVTASLFWSRLRRWRSAGPTSCTWSAGIRSFPTPFLVRPGQLRGMGRRAGCRVPPNWLRRWTIGAVRSSDRSYAIRAGLIEP